MSNQLLSSKIIIQEEAPRIQTVAPTTTSVAVALLVTERGPVGVPTLTTNESDWKEIFGGHIADSDAAAQVEGFYKNNEGGQLWTTRIVHYTDPSDASSKTSEAATLDLQTANTAPSSGSVTGTNASPFAMHDGDTVIAKVNGGGNLTATFNASAAALTNQNNATYGLADGDTLTVQIDGGSTQTVTFHSSEFVDISAATAAEVVAVLNASLVGASASVASGPKVTITSDKKGTGSSVHVTGGSANASGKLHFSTSAATGSGNVSDIGAVTAVEATSVLSGAFTGATVTNAGGRITVTSNTTGGSSRVQILGSSVNGATELGFDSAIHSGSTGAAVNTLQAGGRYDGSYANALSVEILDASSGDSARFNVYVLDGTQILERFPNLSMDSSDARYVETIFNDPDSGSKYLSLTDLNITGTAAQRRPANGTFGPLTGGDDGLSGLADTDFIGDAAGGTGLRSLDQTLGLRILTIPSHCTSAIHNAMITYAEITRGGEMFCVMGPPADMTAVEIQNYVTTTAALKGLSEFGAIYWPRIKILNPNTAVYGTDPQIVVDPVLHIAGVYGRVDASKPGGIYEAPAGESFGRIVGAVGLETKEVLDDDKRDLIYPDLINPITYFPGTPIHMDGCRTLKQDGPFPTIGERRGVIFIEQSLKDFLRSFKHRNNNKKTRGTVDRSATSFLITQMNNDAFASKDPSKAFLFDASEAINPPTIVKAEQMRFRLGLATNSPAEFIILMVGQDTRALEEQLAASQSTAG